MISLLLLITLPLLRNCFLNHRHQVSIAAAGFLSHHRWFAISILSWTKVFLSRENTMRSMVIQSTTCMCMKTLLMLLTAFSKKILLGIWIVQTLCKNELLKILDINHSLDDSLLKMIVPCRR
ncbi:hypothetical protein HID58_042739 [Brassica napus]|uniref:Secreted protein n=1 Tax=Brassica napus TaxID=3708 RepID=A0ABQ8BEK5_BRANA|nr:hypothetical protein HID58_042739 [Brassica napus]